MINYEIRDKDDSGIFITFDTLPEANQWLADMKTRYPKRVIKNGMHVFKHEFKTELEQYQDTGLTPAEVEELKKENEQLKELLRLAVVDMNRSDHCDVCKFYNCVPTCECDCLECMLECECHNCHNADHFTWQHADKAERTE